MLPYERQVVDALIGSDDPARRQAVADHMGAVLAAMPEHLRAGMTGETVLLTTWSAVRRRGRPPVPADELAWLEGHPIGLVRQWFRALRSLVLFAEMEMLAADGSAHRLGDADAEAGAEPATRSLAGEPTR